MSHLISWAAHMGLDVLPTTASHFIPDSVWTNVIAPEVMRQCDALDGVCTHDRHVVLWDNADPYNRQLSDGIINDPRACRYASPAS